MHDYYNNAKNLCRGKLHVQALHMHLKKEGKSACKSMEVTLQISHIKSYAKKTNHLLFWNNFIQEYNKTCANYNNTGY